MYVHVKVESQQINFELSLSYRTNLHNVVSHLCQFDDSLTAVYYTIAFIGGPPRVYSRKIIIYYCLSAVLSPRCDERIDFTKLDNLNIYARLNWWSLYNVSIRLNLALLHYIRRHTYAFL